MSKNSSNQLFFLADEMQWEIASTGVLRQLTGFDDRVMMVNVKFKKGAIGPMHKHTHTQLTYVAEGKFEVTIESVTCVLKKGDSFQVPSNSLHGVLCLEEGILIDVFSPMRADFIK
nr:cupin domain-containing protein [uncultured Flavobacterium sp.]